jgi:hypothetical protein
MKIIQQCKETIRIKKTIPGSCKIPSGSSSVLDKKRINKLLYLFMSNADNIIVDTVKTATTKYLIEHGIKPDNITTVIHEYILQKIDSCIVLVGNIDNYTPNNPVQKISGIYFLFRNGRTLDMFKKSILTLSNQIETIKIATTFYTDRISEPAFYNTCLDIMEQAFPEHSIIIQCSYSYNIRYGSIMYHQQFTLQKND